MASRPPILLNFVSGINSSSGFTPRWFATLLGLGIVAAFPDIIIGARTFVRLDYGLLAYPIARYFRESFWHGEIPLWNPLSNCGLPFLAQWNTLVLYPPSLLYLLLPLTWSLGIFCLLHLYLAGLGMYFLARRWTGNNFAGAVAGLVFAFNGLTLNCLMWPCHTVALAWMPWVILTVETAWREGGRAILIATFVATLQMLSGSPEFIFLTWLLAGFVTLGFWGQSFLPPRNLHPFSRRWPARFGGVILLVAALSAAQLLPFFDLLIYSGRDTSAGNSFFAMPGWGWANFFVPLFYSFPWNAGVFYQYEQYWSSSYYVGVAILLLAAVAILNVRRKLVRVLAAIAAVSLILALGERGHLYDWLKQLVPQIGFMRFPVKFVMLTVFILPLLAAFGIAHCESAVGSAWSRTRVQILGLAAVTLTIIVTLVWFAGQYPLYAPPFDQWAATKTNGIGRAIFLVVLAGLMIALWQMKQSSARGWLRLLLLLVLWLDVQTHAPTQNPTVENWVYDPNLPELKSPPKLGESRVMVNPAAEAALNTVSFLKPLDFFVTSRMSLFVNCNLLDGIPKINGNYSLHLRETEQIAASVQANAGRPASPLADFVGISRTSKPGKLPEWYARPDFMPFATAGQKPVFADESATLNALASDMFQPRAEVYLPANVQRLVTATNQTRAQILSQHIAAQRIDLDVSASEPSIVVLSQSYYHWWQAYVDEQPVPLWRANHAFQALQVPAGQHHVKIVYEDRWFQIGAGISAAALLASGAMWLAFRNRRTA